VIIVLLFQQNVYVVSIVTKIDGHGFFFFLNFGKTNGIRLCT